VRADEDEAVGGNSMKGKNGNAHRGGRRMNWGGEGGGGWFREKIKEEKAADGNVKCEYTI
jgi:hypothetical protein